MPALIFVVDRLIEPDLRPKLFGDGDRVDVIWLSSTVHRDVGTGQRIGEAFRPTATCYVGSPIHCGDQCQR